MTSIKTMSAFQLPRWAAISALFLPLILNSVPANAGGLTFLQPAAYSEQKNSITVKVRVPAAYNANAKLVRLIIDKTFSEKRGHSQTYVRGKEIYTFRIRSREFMNDWHTINVRTVAKGKIISWANLKLNFQNNALVINTPTKGANLTGDFIVSGIVRARAKKINVKFGTIDNNPVVFSKTLEDQGKVKANGFSVLIKKNRIKHNGLINMYVRAIRDGKDLKTISHQVRISSPSKTAIPIRKNQAYFGVSTTDNNNSTSAEKRIAATMAFEKKIFENDQSRLAMNRVFYSWDNLLDGQGKLNKYIRMTADQGRIPVISVATHTNSNPKAPLTCGDRSKSAWRCIADGSMDADIDAFVKQIRNETERDGAEFKMSFTMQHEPGDEIRCNKNRKEDANFVCKPLGKALDLGNARDFKDAWKHLRKKFRPAKNVDFMWIMQGRAYDRKKMNELLTSETGKESYLYEPFDLYPGAQYVDWVAADIYNTGFCDNEQLGTGCKWESLTKLTQPFLDWAATKTPGKPLVIAELGVPEDSSSENDINRRYQWLISAKNFIKKNKEIKAVLYWNRWEKMDGGTNRIRDWRLDSNYPSWNNKEGVLIPKPIKYKANFLDNALTSTIHGAQQMIRDQHFIRGPVF